MSSTDVLSLALPGTLPDSWYDLAQAVYGDDPRWIPEQRAALERDFGPGNAWFASGRARAFLLPGRARIAAYFDPGKLVDGQATAYFGDFASTGDVQGDELLFSRVEQWARAEGALRLAGPMHFTTWHSYRVLVSMEQGGLPFPGEPYDAPTVHQAFERLGFTPLQRYQSQIFKREVFAAMFERFAAGGARAASLGYRAEAVGIPAIIDMLPGFYDRNMEIFQDSYAFTAPPKAVWLAGMHAFLQRACPHTSVVAHDPKGELVGYCVNSPHWGPLVVQARSHRLKVEELDYTKHAALLGDEQTLIIKTLGVSPSHQLSGVGALLAAEVFKHAARHYHHAVGALMREDNRSRKFGSGYYTSERWYALYARPLV